MNKQDNSETRPQHIAERFIKVIDRYDEAWRRNERPDLAGFLDHHATPGDRSDLFFALLPIELEYRLIHGLEIRVDDFVRMIDASERERIETVLASIRDEYADGISLHEKEAPVEGPVPGAEPASGPAIAHYQLLEKLGEGGMGEVWLAQQTSPIRRRVALKLIKAGLDNRQVIERFGAERQALALMDHQNIARVFDAGSTADGQPYFVMELVEGIPLTAYCDRHRLAVRERLELFVTVCHAVQHAHQKGIIHRDLKPSNILVADIDGHPVAKVIDFGLAKALQRDLLFAGPAMATEFGQVLGTLNYMSPEQAGLNHQDVDTRSDIYSLGLILCELLTGHTPIELKRIGEQTILEILRLIRDEEPLRPGVILGSLPNEEVAKVAFLRQTAPDRLQRILRRELDWIVIKAVARDRDRRFGSAGALAADLMRYLSGEPVEARPPSIRYRAGKLVRKYKGLVASLCGMAFLLVAGIIISAWFAYEANQARIVSERKTRELTREQDRAEREKSRAEQREKEAVGALRQFGESIANNPELKNNPLLVSLRSTLLRQPLDFFQTLREKLDEDEGTSADSLARFANAAFSLGFLTAEIGNKEDALLAYREALELQERLVRENPGVTAYLSDLAKSHNNLGSLLGETGKPDEALQAYEQALQIRLQMKREGETSAEAQNSLAQIYNNIGNLLCDTGKTNEALQAFEEALKIRTQLAEENTGKAAFQGSLAVSYNNMGNLLADTGKLDQALQSYQQALKIREQLVQENPDDRVLQNNLAVSHYNIGILLHETGKPAEAMRSYRTAREIQARLAKEHPGVNAYRNDLAQSDNSIGILLGESGNLEEAMQAYQQALQIREQLAQENPGLKDYHSNLAQTHNNMGNLLGDTGKPEQALQAHQMALSIRQKLAQENPGVTSFQNSLAASHYNIGILLADMGKPAEALQAHGQAMKIREQLAENNPEVTVFQSRLAQSCTNVGNLLSESGKPAEALLAHQKSREIQERLVNDNPSHIAFKSDLAVSYINIGNLLVENGRTEEGLQACEKALLLQEQLAQQHPALADCLSDVGGTLNNLAMIDISAGRFVEARHRLDRAIGFQKRAILARPGHPPYKQLLKSHFLHMLRVAEGTGDQALRAETERELSELAQVPKQE